MVLCSLCLHRMLSGPSDGPTAAINYEASLSCVNITAKNVETEDWTKKKAMYLFNLIGNMKRLFTKEQKYTRRNI